MTEIGVTEEELERVYGSLKQALCQIGDEHPDVTWKLIYANPEIFDSLLECVHGEYSDVIFQLPSETIAAQWRLNGIKFRMVS